MTRTLLVLAMLCGVAHAERFDRFDPATTYAVVVGVLHWKDAEFASFAPEDRKDRELYETLGKRGVPAAQRVLLLDEQATTAHVTAAIEKLAAAAPAGSTFLFYYAGHGGPSDDGTDTVLVSYDTTSDEMDETGLHGAMVGKALAGFHGNKVILMADACYTGGLAATAKALWARHIPALALTSASAENSSTANWTFTQTVIDALAGRAELDLDGDHEIDLAELETAVGDAMTHREHQAHGFASYGIPAHLVMADARATDLDTSKRGWTSARGPDGEMQTAKILGAKGGKLLLSFYDYATETQRWAKPDELRPEPAAEPDSDDSDGGLAGLVQRASD